MLHLGGVVGVFSGMSEKGELVENMCLCIRRGPHRWEYM